jgi:hypothetical protein
LTQEHADYAGDKQGHKQYPIRQGQSIGRLEMASVSPVFVFANYDIFGFLTVGLQQHHKLCIQKGSTGNEPEDD